MAEGLDVRREVRQYEEIYIRFPKKSIVSAGAVLMRMGCVRRRTGPKEGVNEQLALCYAYKVQGNYPTEGLFY